MTISLNKISNFFKARKLKRKVKQLRLEIGDIDWNMHFEDLTNTECKVLETVKYDILEEIALLEQQIKELE